MVAEDAPPGADCTVAWGAPEPLGAVALAGGAVVCELGYSSALSGGALDGALSDPAGAALEEGGASADHGEALGPGTSTCTFGGAPFGCGITMIGPTRTGPTCTGPTVTGAGSPSVVPAGLVVGVAPGAGVVEAWAEREGSGTSTREVLAGGKASGWDEVIGGEACFEGAVPFV
ncbi:hypothetical protein [Actinomycetospora termitidis]|uniref:Uncharacterized protein n=1 Tax=Actinomycetospora termitidis TaxID=3053470 RepID=A0ABT7MIK5_9PSEU|nr:hypothetical protein [Actinomycetospora sp. Odt1-22]MDL5160475.1 hypothetical protein [Actinomycetospora sp. Odt1-22]